MNLTAAVSPEKLKMQRHVLLNEMRSFDVRLADHIIRQHCPLLFALCSISGAHNSPCSASHYWDDRLPWN